MRRGTLDGVDGMERGGDVVDGDEREEEEEEGEDGCDEQLSAFSSASLRPNGTPFSGNPPSEYDSSSIL